MYVQTFSEHINIFFLLFSSFFLAKERAQVKECSLFMFKEKSHIKASPSASYISSLQYSQEGSFMKHLKDLMTSCCVVLRVLTLHFTEVSQCCRPAHDRAKPGSWSDWVSFQHSRLTVSAEVAVIKQLSHFSCVLWGTAGLVPHSHQRERIVPCYDLGVKELLIRQWDISCT